MVCFNLMLDCRAMVHFAPWSEGHLLSVHWYVFFIFMQYYFCNSFRHCLRQNTCNSVLLHCLTLHDTSMFCITLNFTLLHYPAPHYTALKCQYCTALHCTVLSPRPWLWPVCVWLPMINPGYLPVSQYLERSYPGAAEVVAWQKLLPFNFKHC